MGRIYSVTNHSRTGRGVRKKTVGREIVIGQTAIKFIAISICTILAIVYLTQSTAGANRSVKVRDLEGKKQQAVLEKERLEVEQTRLKSLKEIDAGIAKEGNPEDAGKSDKMEPVKEVGHVAGASTSR